MDRIAGTPHQSALVLPVALILLGFPAHLLWAQGQRERELPDFYYSFDRKVAVTVYADRLGIVGQSAIRLEQIRSLAERRKLRLISSYPSGIFVMALPEPYSRMDIVRLARRIQSEEKKVIRAAGLVLQEGKSPTPTVVSDEFVVRFRPEVSEKQVSGLNQENGVSVVRKDPFIKNQYLLRVGEGSPLDALSMANRYQEGNLALFAHPNFWRFYTLNETIPTDPLFGNQWHHRNTGASGGTVDADADTTQAWDFTTGSSSVVIGIVDDGFDLNHEDLQGNLKVNSGETAGDGLDNDGNGFIDDREGWDFGDNDANPRPAGDFNDHGTAVTGVAVARTDGSTGVVGACPGCNFVPAKAFGDCFVFIFWVICPSTPQGFADSINYTAARGARIISNSWGSVDPAATAEPVIVTAINNASSLGALVVFAGGNDPSADYCNAAYPSLTNVLAVSGSSNTDRKIQDFAFGNCIDVLAPTNPGDIGTTNPSGTLAITTTDRMGSSGYNNTNPICDGGRTDPADTNYTNCFGGTSSATPLVSGIVGLVLSANPGLNRIQLQRVLQDTTDRIENSAGQYSGETGFSSPGSGVATHAFGRTNAFEAVRVVAPVAQGGRGGVDVFLRDNHLDWGNTEQPSNTLFEPTRGFIGHWRSMDIKVDSPPYGPPPTATTFDGFADETPSAAAGDVNRVYVRVRNRGPVPAATVNVKLLWSQLGTALPPLPPDFWTAFPNDSTSSADWHPLDCATASPSPLPSTVCQMLNQGYSGASVAGCPGRAQPSCAWDLNADGDTADPGETATDGAQIVQFDFPAPAVDPSKPNHFCLLAMADSPQDPISAASRATFVVDSITPNDNNVTHRNYVNLQTSTGTTFGQRFFVRNPYDRPIKARLRSAVPKGWRAEAEPFGLDRPFVLEARQQTLTSLRVTTPGPGSTAQVDITQEQVDGDSPRVMGGLSLNLRPPAGPPGPGMGLLTPYLIGTWDLRGDLRTLVHLINPTAKTLRALVAFFDDNEKLLRCIEGKVSPNDLLEVDVGRLQLEAKFGVVKVASVNEREDLPETGLVGNQRLLARTAVISETGMHPVPEGLLLDDLGQLGKVCRER